MAGPRVDPQAVPLRELKRIEPDPANGLHTCPECGAGVPLMAWKYAQNLVYAETDAERVPRLQAHLIGGAPNTGRRANPDRCIGSHAIPLD